MSKKDIDNNEKKTTKCIARRNFELNGLRVNPNDIVELTDEELDGALFNKLVYKMEE